MSRLIQRPIEVTTENDLPHIVVDGNNTYTVNHIIDWWLEAGAWWDNESPRTMYRVQTEECYLFDLEFSGGNWFIYRIWD